MSNPTLEEMEREVAKRPKTDLQHQPDQSQHNLEIERERQRKQQPQNHPGRQ